MIEWMRNINSSRLSHTNTFSIGRLNVYLISKIIRPKVLGVKSYCIRSSTIKDLRSLTWFTRQTQSFHTGFYGIKRIKGDIFIFGFKSLRATNFVSRLLVGGKHFRLWYHEEINNVEIKMFVFWILFVLLLMTITTPIYTDI